MTAAASPYVGPRALADGEPLYGRAHEVEDLLDLLVANRVALLYSPSGAGKTSLIAAGLLPRLREEGFTVAPIVRIDRPPTAETAGDGHGNRFLESMLASLGDDPAFEAPSDPSSRATASHPAERIAALLLAHASEDLVIVLDQLETLFTLDPGDRAAKTDFMAAVGSLVNRRTMGPTHGTAGADEALDPRPWLLLVLREEFLAALDPYRHLVPGGLDARMRLELLDPERARSAIQGPAAAVGVTITDDAARSLVDDLCAIQVTDEDGTVQTIPGPTVEPVQLQVTCLRLWLQLQPQEGASITAADLPPTSGVTEALGAYYAEAVAAIAHDTGASELAIRDWFGASLIVQHGGRSIRAQVRDGVSPAIRSACEDAHLVRGDERSGVRWYELAHDRLVAPVIEDNARWLQEHARPLLLRARAWRIGARDVSLLLRGTDLQDARAVAAQATDLTAEERELLDASLELERSTRRGRRQRRAFVGLAGMVLVLIVAAGWLALSFADQARKTTAGRLAVLAERQVPWVASVQRLLAADLSGGTQPLLATASCCAPELQRIGRVAGGRVSSLVFDADGRGLVWGEEGDVTFWRSIAGGDIKALPDLRDVRALSWSPDRSHLAIGDGQGRVRLLSAVAVRQLVATGAALDPVVLSAPASGLVDAPSDAVPPREPDPSPSSTPAVAPSSSVTALGWSGDGSTVAAALADGRVVVWRGAGGAAPDAGSRSITIDVGWLGSRPVRVAVSHDGRLVAATADVAGRWAVWSTGGDGGRSTVPGTKGGVVAFLPGEPARLLVGGEGGRLALVTIRTLAPPLPTWILTWDGRLRTPGDAAPIWDVAIQARGDGAARVALARKNGTVQVIDVGRSGAMSPISESLAADPDAAEHTAWSPDGASLAASGRDRSLSVWAIPTPADAARVSDAPLAVLAQAPSTWMTVAPDGVITRTGTEATPFAGGDAVGARVFEAADIAPDGTAVVLGRAGAPIVVVRDGGGPSVIDGSATGDRVTDVAFDRSGTRVAVATARSVRAWDLHTGQATQLVDLRQPVLNPRTQVAWDLSGTGLYVGGCDAFSPSGAACLQGWVTWYPVDAGDASSGRKARRLSVGGWPWSLAVDPFDASRIAVGLKNGRVELIRLDASSAEPATLRSAELVPDNAITQLAFASHGAARLAVGSQSGRVLLVDPDGLWVVAAGVGGSHREVTALSYVDDGSRLVVGSGTASNPRPVAAPGTDPVAPPGPDRVTGAVQVIALDDASLRARACDLAAWLSDEDAAAFLLGQPRPTCRPAPATPAG